jgi:hypothetical protein
MKVYNLTCEHDHHFEGWFASEEDFKTQVNDSYIRCPVCDSNVITKLPSAPRLNLSGALASPTDVRAQVQSQIMELVRQVVSKTEDVGERFAEEARRIHYNEAPERAIRGVASVAECEALNDEGIDVIALPIPEALKQPLQ